MTSALIRQLADQHEAAGRAFKAQTFRAVATEVEEVELQQVNEMLEALATGGAQRREFP